MTAPRTDTVAELGEFSLIAAITAGAGSRAGRTGRARRRRRGAVPRPDRCTSVDVLVEGVHFRRDWSPAADVGRKAVAVNVADIEAMGARATSVAGRVLGAGRPGGGLGAGIRRRAEARVRRRRGQPGRRGRDPVPRHHHLGDRVRRARRTRPGAAIRRPGGRPGGRRPAGWAGPRPDWSCWAGVSGPRAPSSRR